MRLIVMNRIIDLKHHLHLLCLVPSYLPFLLARKFNYVSVGSFSINDLVKLMISCSSFSSFCFLFAFLFWLDTLVTLFEFRILHAGLLYQRKALSYCCGLRTPYWQLKEPVCPTIFRSPFQPGIYQSHWQFFESAWVILCLWKRYPVLPVVVSPSLIHQICCFQKCLQWPQISGFWKLISFSRFYQSI